MSTHTTLLDRFLTAVHEELPSPDAWTPLETYPDSLAECVIDALWSERVRYTNIAEIIGRYRDYRHSQGGNADHDTAKDLLESFDMGMDAWMATIGNHQRAYSRPAAPYKAELVFEAAKACVKTAVITAAHLRKGVAQSSAEVSALKERWLALPSQHSGLTWERLLLVADVKDVPSDGWLQQFTDKAVGQDLSDSAALELVDAAARSIGTSDLRLRNAIWQFQTKEDRIEGHGPVGAHRLRAGAPAHQDR